MPVPKRKTSKSRRDMRQSCKFIRPNPVSICKNCTEPIPSHQACGKCGFYKGRKVITTKTDTQQLRTIARVAAQAKAKNKEHDHAHEAGEHAHEQK